MSFRPALLSSILVFAAAAAHARGDGTPAIRPSPGDDSDPAASAPARLAGHVLGPTGEPVGGASVVALASTAMNLDAARAEAEISRDSLRAARAVRDAARQAAASLPRAVTASSGEFAFDELPAGHYRVIVMHPRFVPHRRTRVALSPGKSERCTVTLAPSLTVTGRVVGPGGNPLSGVAILAWPSARATVRAAGRLALALADAAAEAPITGAGAAVSDAGGVFVIDGLEPLYYDIAARAAGHRLCFRRVVPAGSGSVEIAIEPSVVVRGRVVGLDEDPVEGATVTLREHSDGAPDVLVARAADTLAGLPPRARSGPDGRFRLDADLPAPYRIDVTAPGSAPWSAVLAAGSADSDLGDIQLEEGQVIDGILLAPGGVPVSGARVAAFAASTPVGPRDPGGLAAATSTGTNGRFVLTGLARGPHELVAQAGGFAPARVRAVAGRRAPVTIEIHKAYRVDGRVVDALDRSPVQAALVRHAGEGGEAASSGADGRFAIDGVASPEPAAGESIVYLQVFHPGFRPHVAGVRLAGQDGLPVEIALERGPGVSGTVIDALGDPLPGAMVHAELPGTPPPISSLAADGRTPAVVTGRDGTFFLPVPSWGTAFEVVGAHPGHVAARIGPIWPRSRQAREELTIHLTRGCRLAGRIDDAESRPIQGARVAARRVLASRGDDDALLDLLYAAAEEVASSDAAGRYELSGLEPGVYRIEMRALGCPRQVSGDVVLKEPGETLDFALPRRAAVSGRIERSRGAPLGGAEVVVAAGGGARDSPRSFDALTSADWDALRKEAVAAASTDDEGRYDFGLLPPAELWIVARAKGFVIAAHGPFQPGEPLPALVLLQAGAIVLAAAGESGTPLPRYAFALVSDRCERSGSSDGPAELADLPPGAYRLTVRAGGLLPHEQQVVVLPGARTSVLATLRPGAVLRGVVVAARSGVPVAGAVARLRRTPPAGGAGEPREIVGRATGPDGRFTVDALAPERYEVSVEHPDFYLDRPIAWDASQRPGEAASGPRPAELRCALEPAGRLRGEVLGPSRLGRGADRSRYRVVLTWAGTTEHDMELPDADDGPRTVALWLRRDDDRFSVAGLKPGWYSVELERVDQALAEPARGRDAPRWHLARVEVLAGRIEELRAEAPPAPPSPKE